MHTNNFSKFWAWLIVAVAVICLAWALSGGYLDLLAWQRSPQDLAWRQWLGWSLFLRGLGLAAVMLTTGGMDSVAPPPGPPDRRHGGGLPLHGPWGEPSPLPDAPQGLQDMGRLSLAIQVMHEALLDYLSLYRRFFDAAPDMFLSLAPAGQRILDANTAFCRALGLLKDEVLGQPVERFVELDKGWDRALSEGGELITGQIKGPGGIIRVEASISLEGGPGGQPWILVRPFCAT